MSNPTALVQKLWNYCIILRDDGLSFRLRRGFCRRLGYGGQVGGQVGDCAEKLTFLLFRNPNVARGHAAYNTTRSVPVGLLPSTGAGRHPTFFQP